MKLDRYRCCIVDCWPCDRIRQKLAPRLQRWVREDGTACHACGRSASEGHDWASLARGHTPHWAGTNYPSRRFWVQAAGPRAHVWPHAAVYAQVRCCARAKWLKAGTVRCQKEASYIFFRCFCYPFPTHFFSLVFTCDGRNVSLRAQEKGSGVIVIEFWKECQCLVSAGVVCFLPAVHLSANPVGQTFPPCSSLSLSPSHSLAVVVVVCRCCCFFSFAVKTSTVDFSCLQQWVITKHAHSPPKSSPTSCPRKAGLRGRSLLSVSQGMQELWISGTMCAEVWHLL